MIRVWTGTTAENYYGARFLVTDGDNAWSVENARAAFRDEADLQAFLKLIGAPPWVATE